MRDFVILACFLATAVRYADAQAKADGGFRGGEPRLCDTDWSYRDASGETPATSGCLSVVDHPPYQVDTAPHQPGNPATDTTRWCSFKQNKLRDRDGIEANAIYDITKIDEDKLTAWGYCLIEGGSNSSEPGTEPTSQPTAALPTEGFWADGGFATKLTRCDESWTYRDNGVPVLTEITGCLNGNEYPPFQWNSEGPAEPTLSGTDATKWCSFKGGNKVYDTNPQVDDGDVKKKSWGYCFDAANAVVQTEAPTVESTSEPETGSPTASESNTTDAPAPGSQTQQPTVATTTNPPNTLAPTTSGNPNAASPSSLSSGEIAAAVIVPFLVVIAAGGGFAYYKYHNINKGQNAQPEEAAAKSEGKPVSDPEEGRSGQEILHN